MVKAALRSLQGIGRKASNIDEGQISMARPIEGETERQRNYTRKCRMTFAIKMIRVMK